MNFKRMDKIGENRKVYKEIYVTSCTVLLAIVQMYLILVDNGINIMKFEFIHHNVLKVFLQIFTQVVVLAFLYYLIYKISYHIKVHTWIKQHKSLWLQGTWLHIHEKNNLRAGIVEIKQDFYEIRCRGNNLDPMKPFLGNQFTSWNYTMGLLADDESQRDFMGYYVAEKANTQEKNDGIHALTFYEHDKNGFTVKLKGRFCDTFKVGKQISDVDSLNHAVVLTMFRPSKECIAYIERDGNQMENLHRIISEPAFQSETFVCDKG